MKRWMKNIVVILMTVMTLGFYTPPILINTNTNADNNKDHQSSKTNINEDSLSQVSDSIGQFNASQDYSETLDENDYLIADLTEKAKEQTLTKLGPRIIDQVEDKFMEDILPTMEETLQAILLEANDDLPYYSITEEPTRGFGERIFHVYDNRTEKDIARFHVRRDNRPLEGYWFNFHYHLNDDNFEKHHEIGEIYWDKNIPPKWMA